MFVRRGISVLRRAIVPHPGLRGFAKKSKGVSGEFRKPKVAGRQQDEDAELWAKHAEELGEDGGGEDHGWDDGIFDELPPEEDTIVDMEKDLDRYDRYMGRVVESFSERVAMLKLGVAVADLFDPISVLAYGDKTPFKSVAQTIVKGPGMLNVTVHDPSILQAVEDAITNANLGARPRAVDKNTLEVPIAKPSVEARLALIKSLGQITEKAKIRVRHFRNTSDTRIKKWVHDDNFKFILMDELKKRLDVHNKAIEEIRKKKEADLKPMLDDEEGFTSAKSRRKRK